MFYRGDNKHRLRGDGLLAPSKSRVEVVNNTCRDVEGVSGHLTTNHHDDNKHVVRVGRITTTSQMVPLFSRIYEQRFLFLLLSRRFRAESKTEVYAEATNTAPLTPTRGKFAVGVVGIYVCVGRLRKDFRFERFSKTPREP